METIALFTVSTADGDLTLRIDADNFEIGDDGDESAWAEADYVRITELSDDGETAYVPTGQTWIGHRYDEIELMELTARAYVNDVGEGYTFHEVCPQLDEARSRALSDIACTISGQDIPARYYDYWRSHIYKLVYATNENCYYAYYDSTLMFSADGKLVSDNNFAEDGLAYSIERVLNGEEEELWMAEDMAEYKQEIASSL